ncbi:MAG: hypothetical protein RLN85_18650, partial [Pseudomonadales bacterium]
GNATGTGNLGVYVSNGSEISSTGLGSEAAVITINGTAGFGSAYNTGINMENSSLTSVDGAISLTGQGGSGSNIANFGVNTFNSVISSTGVGSNAATIMIDGTAGSSSGFAVGVKFDQSTNIVTSVDGDITITGRGGSASG